MTKHTKDSIKEILLKNDRAVAKALLVLLERQTDTEKATATTREHNGKGFCSADAAYMTAWAKDLKAGKPLSPKQMAFLRHGRRITKYAGQLAEVANAKEAAKQGKLDV